MPQSAGCRVVTVNEVLDGQVALDLECLDRIYLNAYVPMLQVGGQVVSFLTQHLGNPIPSPAIFEKIGLAFRKSVADFARDNHIAVVRFGKADRKIEVMRPRTGHPGGLQDQGRHPRCRRHDQRVLPALPDQAIPQKRSRAAHRDRHQRPLRPGLPAPSAQSRRPPDQSPCHQPPPARYSTDRPGLRPCESSL